MSGRIIVKFILFSLLSAPACFTYGLAQVHERSLNRQLAALSCTVSGVITDESGALVPGAQVYLKAGTQVLEGETGTRGKINFEVVQEGEFVLRIDHPWFEAQEFRWQCVSGGLIDLKIKLINSGIVTDGNPVREDLPEEINSETGPILQQIQSRSYLASPREPLKGLHN